MLDLTKILAGAGVSNEVVKDAGVIKSDEPASRTNRDKPRVIPANGITHASRLFYAVFLDDENEPNPFPIAGIETFEEAKSRRNDYRELGYKKAKAVSVIEVDYTESK